MLKNNKYEGFAGMLKNNKYEGFAGMLKKQLKKPYKKNSQNSLSDASVKRMSKKKRSGARNFAPMLLMNSRASELRTMSIGLLAPNTIHRLIIKHNDSAKSSVTESIRQAVPMLLL
jgi:hypothetical protein